MIKNDKGSFLGLLPMLVYLVLSLGTAVILGSAKSVPALVLFAVAIGVCFAMNRELSFNDKIDIFASGAANPNIIVMVLIFLLAGAFTTVSKSMGSVDAVVNFSLSVLPANLIIPGLFVIGSFISLAMGTSVGTVVALGPIAMGIVEKTGLPIPFVIGAVLCGAIFGDNLSIVSDTTIAATRLCGVEMKDKFKVNFLIALPAAILTVVIFAVKAKGLSVNGLEQLEYSVIKIIPYIVVIITALMGLNVFVVLLTGVLLSAAIGFGYGAFTILGFVNVVFQGMMGMANIALIAICIGGIVGTVTYNGGITWILNAIDKKISTRKQATFGIAVLISLCEICTGNNTVAIVTAGPIAKQISDDYDVDPRKTAGILDIFACVFHCNIPYSGVMLVAGGIAGINPLLIIPYVTYTHLLFVCAIVAIVFDLPRLKPMEKSISKDEEVI
jgi:Na+/H+ antiporter NhaC